MFVNLIRNEMKPERRIAGAVGLLIHCCCGGGGPEGLDGKHNNEAQNSDRTVFESNVIVRS